ncbi:MAG: hypothetical protein ACRDLK_00515, partial [Gaiellaceae bacterium]
RAVLVIVCCVAVPVGLAGAGTGPATIRITDVQTRDVFVDQGTHGRGAGDLEIIHQALYNHRVTSKPLGRADILCTFLTATQRTCGGTYALPKGTIVTSGAIGNRLLYELAIVGGTELYDNARGAVVVTTTSLKPRREVLVFRLAG